MVAVSGGLIFLGYQLLTYGWSQVRGANAGFFDILWPGRYKVVAPDAASVGTYTPGVGLNNTAQGGTVGLPRPSAGSVQIGGPVIPAPSGTGF